MHRAARAMVPRALQQATPQAAAPRVACHVRSSPLHESGRNYKPEFSAIYLPLRMQRVGREVTGIQLHVE
jgi:hypothetical protein